MNDAGRPSPDERPPVAQPEASACDAWLWRLASVPSVLVGMYLAVLPHVAFEGYVLSGGPDEPVGTADLATGVKWAAVVGCVWLPSLIRRRYAEWWVLVWGLAISPVAGLFAICGGLGDTPAMVSPCVSIAASSVLAAIVWTVVRAYCAAPAAARPRDVAGPEVCSGHVGIGAARSVLAALGLLAAVCAVIWTAHSWGSALPVGAERVIDRVSAGFALAMAPTLCAVVVGMWWRAATGADVLFWRVLWAASIPHCVLLLVCGGSHAWLAASLYLALAVSQLWWTSSRLAPTAEPTDSGATGAEDVAGAGRDGDAGDAGATPSSQSVSQSAAGGDVCWVAQRLATAPPAARVRLCGVVRRQESARQVAGSAMTVHSGGRSCG